MDIMQTILEIERKAQGISDSAAKLQENYEADLQAEIHQREQASRQKVQEQLSHLQQRLDAERHEEMEQLERRYEIKMESLAARCQNQKQVWIDTITKAVTEF